MKNVNPVNILLVEDNEGDVVLIQAAFEESKLSNTIHIARDGEQGLDFVYQRNGFENTPRPDLILLDLNMPKINGRQVIEDLKSNEEYVQIPIIVLTSSEAEIDVEQSYDLGANCYVVKPLSFDKFSFVIHQIETFWSLIVQLPRKRNY